MAPFILVPAIVLTLLIGLTRLMFNFMDKIDSPPSKGDRAERSSKLKELKTSQLNDMIEILQEELDYREVQRETTKELLRKKEKGRQTGSPADILTSLTS